MLRSIHIIFVGIVIFLAACSGSKDPRNKPAPLVEFEARMSIKTVWSAEVGPAKDYIFEPAQVGDSIFAASANGNIIRLNSANGQQNWKVNTRLPLTAGVGADSSTLAVAGEKGAIFAYDLDGRLRWTMQASSEILAAPAVGAGVVVVRSVDNHIAAYDSETGKRRWVINRTLPPLMLRSTAGMVIASNHVFVGLPGGKLIAIDLANGNVRWEATVAEPRGSTELERVADVSGKPVVIGSDICASAYQGRVACFDMYSGVMRWGKKLSTDTGLGVDGRFVFAVDDKDTVQAFSRNAGLNEWKTDTLAYRRLSGPVSYGQAVVVADSKGYVHFLSREDGTYLARASTDSSGVSAAPIVAGPNIIFQTKAGKVIAFSIS